MAQLICKCCILLDGTQNFRLTSVCIIKAHFCLFDFPSFAVDFYIIGFSGQFRFDFLFFCSFDIHYSNIYLIYYVFPIDRRNWNFYRICYANKVCYVKYSMTVNFAMAAYCYFVVVFYSFKFLDKTLLHMCMFACVSMCSLVLIMKNEFIILLTVSQMKMYACRDVKVW